MAYGLIAAATSFVTIMGWKRPFLRWRWILHALFLVAVTAALDHARPLAVESRTTTQLARRLARSPADSGRIARLGARSRAKDPLDELDRRGVARDGTFPALDVGGSVLPILGRPRQDASRLTGFWFSAICWSWAVRSVALFVQDKT